MFYETEYGLKRIFKNDHKTLHILKRGDDIVAVIKLVPHPTLDLAVVKYVIYKEDTSLLANFLYDLNIDYQGHIDLDDFLRDILDEKIIGNFEVFTNLMTLGEVFSEGKIIAE